MNQGDPWYVFFFIEICCLLLNDILKGHICKFILFSLRCFRVVTDYKRCPSVVTEMVVDVWSGRIWGE